MNDCYGGFRIVIDNEHGLQREVYDSTLGRFVPDDSWWHPAMEDFNAERQNENKKGNEKTWKQ